MSKSLARPAARSLTWADAAIILTVLIWGFNNVVVKATIREIPPLAFTALRFMGAAIIEVGILRAMGENLRMPWRDMRRMLGLSFFGIVVYQALFVLGIERTTAGNTSVLLATIPIFVALYNGVIRRQRLERNVWLGVALTIAGILLLTLGRGQALSAQWATLLGDFLIVLGAIGWAVYTVGAQALLQTYSPLKLTTLSMLLSAPALTLMAMPDFISASWASVSPAAWSGLVFSGIFSIAVAYLLWNVSVQKLGDTRAAVYSNATPIISVIAAHFFLGEYLNALQGAGALIVLVGVWLARFGLRRPSAREELL